MTRKNVFDIKDKISGEAKFSNLAILVKSCLSLPHGNADVDRGFSINNAVVTRNRVCLSEASIIAVRHVKRNGEISHFPITEKLLTSVGQSYSKYKAAIEAEKKAAEVIIKKRALEEKQQNEERKAKELKEETGKKIKEIDKEITGIKEHLVSAQKCLTEGNQRLQKSVKTKKFDDI